MGGLLNANITLATYLNAFYRRLKSIVGEEIIDPVGNSGEETALRIPFDE